MIRFYKKTDITNFLKKNKTEKNYNQLYLKGIGFKIFTFRNYIAFDLGTSNIILWKNLDKSLKIKIVKDKLFLFSKDLSKLNNVSMLLKNLIKANSYKGKGIYNVKDKIILKEMNKK